MTIRHQIEFETVFFLLVAIFLAGFFVWRSNQNLQNNLYAATPIISEGNTPKIIVPTLNPILKIETASQISPDGTKKLTMEKTHNRDKTVSYVFTTSDGDGNNPHEVYTTQLSGSEDLSLPFNTWSPDNKYVFIQKNEDNALVFKATGEPITNTATFFDIQDSFKEKDKKNVPSVTTGWASETLLIVNTIKEDGTKGPSYWFEVPGKAIMQLSSNF
ncbi:hypothetical protein A3D77_04175 [Candidatus Gottesmanbacteria bacterium RIFCSPHIGHO2_02_FULL_39_11]|uniref:Dipeptidylpeptidase IV N-terminal domain-containing protein n=1 Tax=Candidatus Gottesmanbacteria bacterium RIFCSPHIGHO2_02_FULL_39_11 TaxID=1798382 RepID=A0A1F5ZK31_9BACT|nr:MAG: hypothetical protein A3D77_04175 [Candidatus Gottesmanbacteria bacterium RIFCSPHIGHO2_02_FULL_39_11]